ncbi:MAG: hypothetical protein ACI9FU_001648 [Granulosicoccus sp.]|jgi:hypothetical protein
MKVSMKLLLGGALVSAIFTGRKKYDPIPEPSSTDGLVMLAGGYTDGGSMKINLFLPIRFMPATLTFLLKYAIQQPIQ